LASVGGDTSAQEAGTGLPARRLHGKASASEEELVGHEPDFLPKGLASAEGEGGGRAAGAESGMEGGPTARAANMAVAMCLIGGITFTMGIFYLVNHPDTDMRMYSWEVVSCTISIFVAVLLFHALQAVLHNFDNVVVQEWPSETTMVHVLSNIGLFMICYIFTHMVMWRVALLASADKADPQACENLNGKGHLEQEGRMSVDREQQMVCWSTLLAHMSSFAAIHLGGSVQHYILGVMHNQDDRVMGPITCFLGVIPTWLFLFFLFRGCDVLRSHYLRLPAAVFEIWDEAAEDAEDDVGSLALSFLMCQSARFAICGKLAGPEGRVPEDLHVTPEKVGMLFGVVILAGLGRVFLMWMHSAAASARQASSDTGWGEYCHRWIFILGGIISQLFAWCLLYVIAWTTCCFLERYKMNQKGFGINTASTRAVMTLLVSITAFCAIWAIDCMSDVAVDPVMEKALRSIIKSLGVLVGFSWEQAFAAGIEDIVVNIEEAEAAGVETGGGEAGHSLVPVFVKTGMAIVLSIVVVPAWRMYILKNVLKLRREFAEQKGDGHHE